MSSKAVVLKKAEFNPRLKTYLNLYGLFLLSVTIIGLPLIPFWLLLAPIYIGKYFERLECELTTRSLRFKKGYLVQVEKTIPLDKIQDLTFKEGPLLKFLGLSILKIETAGNSASASADLSLIGILDATTFREMVFDQRDKVTEYGSGSTEEANEKESLAQLMSEVRDSLLRIEKHITSR
jgi:putative membrane protein